MKDKKEVTKKIHIMTPEQILNKHLPVGVQISEAIKQNVFSAMEEFAGLYVDNDYTHIAICLDASTSMAGIAGDIIGGFNNFIEKQKSLPGRATVSLLQFSYPDRIKMLYNFADLKTIEPLTSASYRPDGNTALNDAFAKLILNTRNELMNLPGKRPGKVLFISLTDGEENASVEYRDTNKLRDLIKESEGRYGWEFVYIGANQDSFAEGNARGFARSKSANFTPSSMGISAMYANLDSATVSYRSGKGFNFHDTDNNQ